MYSGVGLDVDSYIDRLEVKASNLSTVIETELNKALIDLGLIEKIKERVNHFYDLRETTKRNLDIHELAFKSLSNYYIKERERALESLGLEVSSLMNEALANDYKVTFEMDNTRYSDKLKIKVNGRKISSTSGGEGQSLSLGLTMIISKGFVVMDETLNSLDETARNFALEFINSMKTKGQIFIIELNEALDIDSTVTLNVEKGVYK